MSRWITQRGLARPTRGGLALTRRDLLRLSAAGLVLPRPLLAATGGAQRKFLFIFCPGGWDQLQVFCTVYTDNTTRETVSEPAEVGGISFVDSLARPSVRSFLERWAAQTLIVNGLNVPSIAHEVCLKIMMTGNTRGNRDDWVSLIAGAASGDLPMPGLHISGPIYPLNELGAVVRVGLDGQLPQLLDGSGIAASTRSISAPDAGIQALEDNFVAERAATWRGGQARGRGAVLGEAAIRSLDQARALQDLSGSLELGDASTLTERASLVIDCLEQGISRVGVLAYDGMGDTGWDTHSGNGFQSYHFEELFSGLSTILEELDARVGEAGGSLLDETTVVVMSEMGRLPLANASGGKEHWTWTSAMLLGSGVAGGQTVGGWSESIEGVPTDLASGQPASDGVTLSCASLGATILALADIDPGSLIDPAEGDVIAGALR